MTTEWRASNFEQASDDSCAREQLGDPGDDTYPMPSDGWVCFHCGLRCLTPKSARIHFGETPVSKPKCLLNAEDSSIRISEEDFRILIAYADIGCQVNHRNETYDAIIRRLLQDNPNLSFKIKAQIS